MPPKFEETYGITCTLNPYNVNYFSQLGWVDPFPNEDDPPINHKHDFKKVPWVPADIIYPLTRFHPKDTPMIIYIPSKEIMFKMMRACVNCKTPEELWVNQNVG